MTSRSTEELIAELAREAAPVRPLAPPLLRALPTVFVLLALCGVAVGTFGDVGQLLRRYAGREDLLAWEMTAMLATGILAVTGAFFVSIPGRSRLWLFAPMPTFAAWLLLSGMGCYSNLIREGGSGWEIGKGLHCLLFIVAGSLFIAAPLIWRLSRARSIDPLPVALLGGLGTAAFAAFLLQFFHPFAVTFIDLAFHLAAILLVVGATALVRRPALSPA